MNFSQENRTAQALCALVDFLERQGYCAPGVEALLDEAREALDEAEKRS